MNWATSTCPTLRAASRGLGALQRLGFDGRGVETFGDVKSQKKWEIPNLFSKFHVNFFKSQNFQGPKKVVKICKVFVKFCEFLVEK